MPPPSSPFESPALITAIDDAGAAATALGDALHRIADAARAAGETTKGKRRGHPKVDTTTARLVELLLGRLGDGNREFIWHAVMQFEPGEEFTLDELAEAASISVPTARARLMNIGRSLKALSAQGVLWETEWDDYARKTIYEWTYAGHEAVLQELAS